MNRQKITRFASVGFLLALVACVAATREVSSPYQLQLESMVRELTDIPFSIQVVENHRRLASVSMRVRSISLNAAWTRALMNRNPNLMRAVLAHEIAHVQAGHYNIRVEAGEVIAQLSQELEFEADRRAAETLHARGFSPRDYLQMMKLFREIEDKNPSGSTEQFYSSHPYAGERLARVEQIITSLGPVERPAKVVTPAVKQTGQSPQYALDSEAYNKRGLAFLQMGQADQAIADFDRALAINPRHAAAYNNRGLAYERMGQYDQAITEFSKAIEFNSKYAAAMVNRGNAYRRQNRHEEAIMDYTRALNLNPRLAAAYNNRGLAQLSKGRHDEAMADFGRAIELNPKYAEAYGNRATVYYQIKDYDGAWSDVNRAQDLGRRIDSGFLKELREASGRQQ